jgi:hypothetical protein
VAAGEKAITPVRLTIVLSRYQGDKKASSLPYTLVVNANGPKASLRMGSSVRIPVADVRVVEPPRGIKGFSYFMAWHARLTAEPARVWFRQHLRKIARTI